MENYIFLNDKIILEGDFLSITSGDNTVILSNYRDEFCLEQILNIIHEDIAYMNSKEAKKKT